MSQRDMTYDLDGVFASRNQGQLVSAQQSQQQIVRTPGLRPVKRTLMGYVEAPSYAGTAGWMDDTTDLPLIGTVSNKTLLLGAAGLAAAVGLFFVLKRKK
jgi:hypothetical protein